VFYSFEGPRRKTIRGVWLLIFRYGRRKREEDSGTGDGEAPAVIRSLQLKEMHRVDSTALMAVYINRGGRSKTESS